MMYGYDFSSGDGWFMLAAMAILAIAILGSVWMIVHRPRTATPSGSSSDDILRERFARGEINAEQFDEAKKRLG
jgi:putative membrane protein